MHEPVPRSLAADPPANPIAFHGERRPFRQLVLRGALLELITLGFYRFWLATDIRRHLWAHTSVDGDGAEYTGRARELLIGFLVAMAILAPIYLVYFVVGLEVERWQAFASTPLILFLYLFSLFAIYRARRYRLTRTVWRGMRFSAGGSGWRYALIAVLWDVFVGMTLGLALPWRQAALERFKMYHTAYGSLQGRFVGTGRGLFKRGWWLWLLTPFAVFLIVPLPFLYAAYKAIEWRWWVENIRFGEVRFKSELKRRALFGVYWKVVGWSLLLLALLGGWGAGLVYGVVYLVMESGAQSQAAFLGAMQHPAVLAAWVVAYLLAAVAFGAIVRLYLTRDVWAKIAGTTLVLDLAAADHVLGQGDAVDALGEGFGGSLDIGGF